jgi:hypothetical protein
MLAFFQTVLFVGYEAYVTAELKEKIYILQYFSTFLYIETVEECETVNTLRFTVSVNRSLLLVGILSSHDCKSSRDQSVSLCFSGMCAHL